MDTTKTSTKQPATTTGFTIIELLVATVVFSIVLIVVLAAFVQISRLFYKGVYMSNTQNATREITQDLENDIQFAPTQPASFTLKDYDNTAGNNPPHAGSFCVAQHRYSYYLGKQVDTGIHDAGVYRETFQTGCPSLADTHGVGTSADQLLSNGMQLNAISLDCKNSRCLIDVHVVFYGGNSDGLFYSANKPTSPTPWLEPDAECTGSLESSQYCATADYERTVLQTL